MSKPLSRARVVRFLVVAVSAAAVFVALIGFAHTKAGRPLLALLGRTIPGMKPAGCPLGFDRRATAEERAAGQARFAAGHRGERAAAGRPALGFELDETTRADVFSWAARAGVHCDEPRAGHDLECSAVPAAALGERDATVDLESIWLDFDARGKLASVTGVRRDRRVSPLRAAFTQVVSAIEHRAGESFAAQGDASDEALASGPLYQAAREYRFSNYYAVVRATNLGDSYLLTEQYRSLGGA